MSMAACALITFGIMFFACIKNDRQDILIYVTFGVILFIIDMLLCTAAVSHHSAAASVAFVTANTTGIALMLVNHTSIVKLLIIVLTATAAAILFCRFMPAVSHRCSRSAKSLKISLLVITALTVFLYLTLFLFHKINGARVWMTFGPVSIQCSEITKLLYLIALSLIAVSPHLSVRKQFLYSLGLLMINTVFLIVHNELGTILVMVMIFTIVQLVFFPTRYGIITLLTVIVLLLLCVLVVQWAYSRFQDVDHLVMNLVKKVYLRLFPKDTYQRDIALQSFVNAGMFGADASYRLDIPVAESDYAFARLVQTFGILSGILYIGSLIATLFTIHDFAEKNRLNRNYILSFIFAATMIVQSGIVIFTNTGVLPITGINAVFISEGGSQCVLNYIMAAVIVHSLSKKNSAKRKHLKRKEIFTDDTSHKNKNKRHFIDGGHAVGSAGHCHPLRTADNQPQ